MRKTQRFLFEQVGRSMIEMLGVLGIIGVLSVGGLSGYSSAMKKHKINQTEEQVVEIVSKAKAQFAQTKRLPQVTTADAIKLGFFPEEMIKNSTTIENRFKGNVTFSRADCEGRVLFKLSYGGLPDDVAASLAMGEFSRSDQVAVRMVNGVSYTTGTLGGLLRREGGNEVSWCFR